MAKRAESPIQKNAAVVSQNIALLATAHGLKTDKAIAQRIGIAASTYCDRRHHPAGWTLEQLLMAAMAFHTSLDWIVTKHDIG